MPKTKKIKGSVNFLLEWLQKIFNIAAIAFLLGIVFVVLFQIFARYALPKAPVWTEELSRFLFVYTIIFASASVIIQERHVNLELFQHRLSEKWTNTRVKWSEKEDEKFNRMFERFKGDW